MAIIWIRFCTGSMNACIWRNSWAKTGSNSPGSAIDDGYLDELCTEGRDADD
ncbi:hypothetical protein LNN31_10205 [Acetobacterium wieringae]|uniref:Uncharacterized protein n=1 Tax=Acetobacterium wieringae TaxID=52694 RepID=A0A1F2PF34_9FIRM|nr:hypothetical protein [Acetobacterium wieringae]OFV69594.1 hypothetical protein ACWI_30490 [Acetobacterium wieringae]URN82785.1 hypothetical protein CHL1_001880 [Acetobacterium wieringae]UYO61158.1 hypothetical protein LNN31_10205 [Acetobacterium wieringae]